MSSASQYGDFERWQAALRALACVCGGAGVALAALAAHRFTESALMTAASFLILHAAAALGLIAGTASARWPRLLLVAVSLMVAGVALFSGDIASRVTVGGGLFPMAAPIGGSTLIASWALAAVAWTADLLKR